VSPPPNVAQNLLKTNGSPLTPIRRCFTRECCPGSLLYILIKIRLSSRTARLCTLPFSFRKNHCALARLWITVPGAYCRRRGTLWLTQKWALWSKPSGICSPPKLGNAAVKLPWPLPAAVGISSQATVLLQHLKVFSG
jgi:hypothetical protein